MKTIKAISFALITMGMTSCYTRIDSANTGLKVAELERKKLFPLSNNINNKTLII